MITKTTLQSMKETELQKKVLVPLFEAMGYEDVKIHQGTTEYGKDLVMWKPGELGQRQNWVVVAKSTPITGKASGRSSAAEVRFQIEQAFTSQWPDSKTAQPQTADRCYVVCSKEIKKEALDALQGFLRANNYDKLTTFIDGKQLWKLVQKYNPEDTVLGKLKELQAQEGRSAKRRFAPITISPQTINLSESRRDSTLRYEIFAVNHTDINYYQVFVKVIVTSPSIRPEHVTIYRPAPDDEIARMNFSTLPTSDSFSYLIRRLGPRERLKLILECKYPGELPASSKHLAELSIEKFSMDALPTIVINTPKTPDRPDIILKDILLIDGVNQNPMVQTNLINIGASAHKIAAELAVIYGLPLTETYRPPRLNHYKRDVIETGEGPYLDTPIPAEVIAKVKNREVNLYSWGEVSYSDQAGKPFVYEFCRHFNPETNAWDHCAFHNRSY
ncbi:MAG TPA: hypothetical protein VI306_06485 [Pyrinomonadaceae bacterium]